MRRITLIGHIDWNTGTVTFPRLHLEVKAGRSFQRMTALSEEAVKAALDARRAEGRALPLTEIMPRVRTNGPPRFLPVSYDVPDE